MLSFGARKVVGCALVEVAVAQTEVVIAGLVARRGQRVDTRNVHVMAAVDERRIPSAAYELRVEIHPRDLVGARPRPPFPSELTPLHLERGSVGEDRRERRSLNPVREVGERRRRRIHKRRGSRVGQGLGVVLRRIGQRVVRVDAVVQLGGVVPQRREHRLGQPGVGVVVAGCPVVGVQVAEGIEPPEFVAHQRAADVRVDRLVAGDGAGIGDPLRLELWRKIGALEGEWLAVVEEQTVEVVAAALHDEVVERASDGRVGALACARHLDLFVDVRILVLQ